jgi:hypothetical protein
MERKVSTELPFLFIAYKSDSVDFRCGEVVERYTSDCVVEMLTEDQLIQHWATHLHMDMNTHRGEYEWDIWVFKNGEKVWDTGDPASNQAEAVALYQQAKLIADARQHEQIESARRLAEESQAKKEREERDRRRQQFKTLQREFDPPGNKATFTDKQVVIDGETVTLPLLEIGEDE